MAWATSASVPSNRNATRDVEPQPRPHPQAPGRPQRRRGHREDGERARGEADVADSREGDRPGPRRRRQRPDEQRRQQDSADLPGDGGDRDGPGAEPDLAGADDHGEHEEAGEVLAGREVEPPAGEQGPDPALAQRRCAVGDLGEPARPPDRRPHRPRDDADDSVPSTIVKVNGTRRSRSGTPPVRREAHSSKEASCAGVTWGAGLGGAGARGAAGFVTAGVGAGAAAEGAGGVVGADGPSGAPAGVAAGSITTWPDSAAPAPSGISATPWSPPRSDILAPRLRTIVCVAPAAPQRVRPASLLVRSVRDFCGWSPASRPPGLFMH